MKNEQSLHKAINKLFPLLMIASSAILSSCGAYSLDWRDDYNLRLGSYRISGGSERNKDVEKHTQPASTTAGVINVPESGSSIKNALKSSQYAPSTPRPARHINKGSDNPAMTYKTWRRTVPVVLMQPASLKREPTNNANTIMCLNTGDRAFIIGESGNWVRIRHILKGSMQGGWIRWEGLRAIDFEDQYFKRWFHFAILSLYEGFWLFFLVLIPFFVLSFIYLPKKASGWALAVCLAFVLIGAFQGYLYKTGYLNYINGIFHKQSLGFYYFCNVFFVPIFFVFHGGILPYFIILCISIKEHGLARRADLELARRIKGEKEVAYKEDEVESVSAYWDGGFDEVAEKNKLHNPNKEEIMLPDIPDLRNKMKSIGQYFLEKSKDSAPSFDIEYLEGAKARFLTQFKFISEGENKKLNLLIQHVNGVIEYERARNRLDHVEGEKRLDDARRYTEYKKLQAECMKHELEIVKLSQEMEKVQGTKPLDPVKEIKERLRLENKKKEVYLDDKVKSLRRECANNIKLKRELRKLLAEETLRICGGKERHKLNSEQLRELEDVEDYIQNEIDRL